MCIVGWRGGGKGLVLRALRVLWVLLLLVWGLLGCQHVLWVLLVLLLVLWVMLLLVWGLLGCQHVLHDLFLQARTGWAAGISFVFCLAVDGAMHVNH